MNSSQMWRLGVDGGGTTTRAVVIDAANIVCGRGEAASSNYHGIGIGRAAQNVADAVHIALQNAGITSDSLHSAGFGLAGLCSLDDRDLWLCHLPFKNENNGDFKGRIVMEEDAVAAQIGAFGGGAGVVCIAGTGANCFGIAPDGRRARADGHGSLLGDRGSGYWIGQSALRAVCSMSDGCETPTPLLAAVWQAFGCASSEQLVSRVHVPDFEKSQVAALFPLVCRCAASGDVAARTILDAAGTLLAQSTLAVLEALQLDRVAVTGGVLSRDTPVRAAYEAVLRHKRPGVSVADPLFDAAIGAALMGQMMTSPSTENGTQSTLDSILSGQNPT